MQVDLRDADDAVAEAVLDTELGKPDFIHQQGPEITFVAGQGQAKTAVD